MKFILYLFRRKTHCLPMYALVKPLFPLFQHKQKQEQQLALRAKKEEIEVMSTTALILENRPM